MKFISYLLAITFCSCNRQNDITLTFINKSSVPIDSIIIGANKIIKLGQIAVGQRYSKKLNHIKVNTNREGLFGFTACLNGRRSGSAWGFHDYGRIFSNQEVFYIYDNGITKTDKPLMKPKALKLYFYNSSLKNIDTFLSANNGIIKVNEMSPRNVEIIYDYDKIEKLKEFIVVMSGTKMNYKIDFHDFDNWNNTQDFLHIESDKIQKGIPANGKPLEYIVDIEIKIPLSADSITIKSAAITKTYNIIQPKYKSFVFDFEKLRQHPIFIVNAGNKNYVIDFSKHDFSNIYDHQKIFALDGNGIKSLTD